MIRVTKRSTPPAVLTTRGIAAAQVLCAAYSGGTRTFKSEDFDKSIYAAEEVKAALREDQHRKCAFCESRFDHTGYGDVEHYRPKAGYKQRASEKALRRPGYYWLAYDWANLFYSCQLCNQQFKRNHFPLADGRQRARSHTADVTRERPLLVCPAHDPAVYIGFRAECAFAAAGNREGTTTIAVLGLNRDALLEARLKQLENLDTLRNLCRLLRERVAEKPTAERHAELARYETKLRDATEDHAEYTATARAHLAALPT